MPPGRSFIVTAPSRQHAGKLIEALDGTSTRALAVAKSASAGTKPKPTNVSTLDTDRIHSDTVAIEPDGLGAEDSDVAAVRRGAKLIVRTLADATEPHLRRRKCRVIVRNLSFQATEFNVGERLSRFGPIVDINLPRVEVGGSGQAEGKFRRRRGEAASGDPEAPLARLRPRGFAFVTFLCAKDAQAAVDGSAGLRVCNREVSCWSLNRTVST